MGGPRQVTVVRTPLIGLGAIHVMWLREMIRFVRAPSRVIGSLVMPLLFLGFLGVGLRGAAMGIDTGGDYLTFLAPGMIGMTLLMGSVFSGLHVLWDRQFGFLREIMVTPVSRLSIVLGRVAGGMTIALIQGSLVGVGAVVLGAQLDLGLLTVLQTAGTMVLISMAFVSVGLIFASVLDDMHGFSLIVNFFVFPIFFLSGALFPVENLPGWVRPLCYADPLTYGVDLMRGTLTGVWAFHPLLDLGVLAGFGLVAISVGSWLFSRLEVN